MKRISGIMLFAGIIMFCFSISATTAHAQKKKNKESTGDVAFTTLPSGLQYKIVSHGNGTRKPVIGDHIELNILFRENDSVLFDSRKMNNNAPVPIPVSAPKFKGDVMEGIVYMTAGDSAVFKVAVDTLKKNGMPLPPFSKNGDFIQYEVKLVSVKTEAEEKQEQAEKAEKQKSIDEKLLKEYFTKNNIKPLKTASGLYYTIDQEGTGETIKPGLTASVNYTGMFMDGKKFDSNTDPAFKHPTPFDVEVGAGHVIKGWDEGLQLMKKGTKATLYIPSTLAYGSTARQGMPANSILIFNMEIMNVVTAEEKKKEMEEKQQAQQASAAKQNEIDDKLLQEYFAKNNIKATKTESGLYYVITQKGLGNNAKPGNKVTMNYTGKTLDGKTFDSNTDPQFNHVQPFSFTLGKGMVIKGWDEGVQLLKMGSKGTFYIPSSLAYGAQGAGAAIPPNTVLMFDVEVTGIDKQ